MPKQLNNFRGRGGRGRGGRGRGTSNNQYANQNNNRYNNYDQNVPRNRNFQNQPNAQFNANPNTQPFTQQRATPSLQIDPNQLAQMMANYFNIQNQQTGQLQPQIGQQGTSQGLSATPFTPSGASKRKKSSPLAENLAKKAFVENNVAPINKEVNFVLDDNLFNSKDLSSELPISLGVGHVNHPHCYLNLPLAIKFKKFLAENLSKWDPRLCSSGIRYAGSRLLSGVLFFQTNYEGASYICANAKIFNKEENNNQQLLFATMANRIEPLYEVRFETQTKLRDIPNFAQNFYAQNTYFFKNTNTDTNEWRDLKYSSKKGIGGSKVILKVDKKTWEELDANPEHFLIIEGNKAKYNAMPREYPVPEIGKHTGDETEEDENPEKMN